MSIHWLSQLYPIHLGINPNDPPIVVSFLSNPELQQQILETIKRVPSATTSVKIREGLTIMGISYKRDLSGLIIEGIKMESQVLWSEGYHPFAHIYHSQPSEGGLAQITVKSFNGTILKQMFPDGFQNENKNFRKTGEVIESTEVEPDTLIVTLEATSAQETAESLALLVKKFFLEKGIYFSNNYITPSPGASALPNDDVFNQPSEESKLDASEESN